MSSDSESSGMIDLLAWFETNKEKLYAGGVILLLVGFIGYFWNWNTTRAASKASNALYEVRSASAQMEEEVPDPSKLLSVVSQHAGSDASGRAMLFAGNAFFKQGKYEEALEQFETFSAEFDNNPLRGTAMYGIAVCKDALGKASEATDAYRRVASNYANSYLAHQAKLALAGLYESQGDPSQALTAYDEFSHAGVSDTYRVLASTRREALLKKHPELAPVEEVSAPVEEVSAPE
jgi:outer membrane protein assembly factor BamD (BamD/ComL family)